MKNTLLHLFLWFDVFVMGAVAAEALRHALAHYRPVAHDADHINPKSSAHLPPAVREKMLADAQASFEAVLKQSTRDLQADLRTTAEEIKKHVEQIGTEATNKELDHYKSVVAELENQTKEDIKGVDNQKTQLRSKLAAEIAAEKKHLLEQIDTKLADAVTSFLTEALGHDVDLGAQGAYLTKLLEEHKADFAREVDGGQS